MSDKKPNILLFMSDQHGAAYMGSHGHTVETPNLDQLCRDGVSFEEAYTSCPLCVPARMAMLSGIPNSALGIFTNLDTLPSTQPTFLHSLAAAGYETVLIGRMHFLGADQRHGFQKRIAPDFTSATYTRPPSLKKNYGVHLQTMGYKWCTHVVGGGSSPNQLYDEMVVEKTLEYLKEEHTKPQFIIVGTYGPHFPYVCREDLFHKYLKQSKVPATYQEQFEDNPILHGLQEPTKNDELVRACQAAYFGLVEQTDSYVGRVRSAFSEYIRRKNTTYLFGYFSDHGDTLGEHGIFGKKTFFEQSARIPLILEGTNLPSNVKINHPVSMLDIAPTMCCAGSVHPTEDMSGMNLLDYVAAPDRFANRYVVSESMDKNPEGNWCYGGMVRQGDYKYITYHGYEESDLLFNVKEDRVEQHNLRVECPEIATQMRGLLKEYVTMEAAEQQQSVHERHAKLIQAFERQSDLLDVERFTDYPEEAKESPHTCVATLVGEPGFEQKSIFIGLPKEEK